MHELNPPPQIAAIDWAITPPSVRALVHRLLTQVQADHLLLRQQIATLQTQVAELEARLNRHSGNSSRPPSSDPPSAPPRPPTSASGRTRGAQPGHPGQHRDLLPPDEVTEFVVHAPTTCSHCRLALPDALPSTGPVIRQQVWELPPVVPTVTEHQFPTVICPHCQTAVRAPHPPDVPPGSFGPHLAALVALLHGRYRLSTRELARLVDELWHIPISLGSIPALYQTVSCALAPVYQEVHPAVQAQAVAHVDETPWRESRQHRYLWVAVTLVVTVFLVARRSRAALEQLLGAPFGGVAGSDRYKAYAHLPATQRQLCWAHLQRDWQCFQERDGPVGVWGAAASKQISKLVATWHRFRVGEIDRATLHGEIAPIEEELRGLAEWGRDTLPWEKARGFWRDRLGVWPALWTLVTEAGVEPTNNVAERGLRPAVLWRKGCYGTDSEAGSRFVERIRSVTTTCRQQQRPALPFIADAVRAHWTGLPAPTLLSTL